LKVLVKLFQKLAKSKGSAFGRAPQSAKNFCAFLFCKLFSLRLLCQREKRLTNLAMPSGYLLQKLDQNFCGGGSPMTSAGFFCFSGNFYGRIFRTYFSGQISYN